MCGIAGILRCQDPGEGRARALAMRQALAHRGPDGAGFFEAASCILVHTRLALLDPEGGLQPMVAPGGRFALALNGEVYNHAALRRDLTALGHELRSRSDTEVLLRALMQWGPAALDRVEGEYAFCFVDTATNRALLGRDPLGVKPLLIARVGRELWFASEAKALAGALPSRPSLRDEAVAEALLFPAWSGVRCTPFEGVEVVEAGALLEVDDDGVRALRSFSLPIADDRDEAPPPSLLLDALGDAVRDRMAADAEVVAFLSGGVDSSSLVGAAIGAKAGGPLRCFTIRFDDHDRVPIVPRAIVVSDDAPFVEQLAGSWPIDLARVQTTPDGLVADIEALSRSQDRIAAWEQELTQRALAREASRAGKAVLVGDAADETHWGYFFLLDDDVCRSPERFLSRFGGDLRLSLLAPRLRGLREGLLARYRDLAAAAGHPFEGAMAQRRRAMAHLTHRLWLGRLLHNGDVHTMAFGLEARVPFADRRVLDVASRVPAAIGYDASAEVPEKRFLRRAVAPLLPPSIALRRKSALPRDPRTGRLMQRDLARLIADMAPALSPYLDLDEARALTLRDALDEPSRAALFSCLSFAHFVRAHAP